MYEDQSKINGVNLLAISDTSGTRILQQLIRLEAVFPPPQPKIVNFKYGGGVLLQPEFTVLKHTTTF